MKALFALFLCYASVCAAETGVRVAASTITNAARASITTTEVFTRDGQTNLIRQTNIKGGVVQVRLHWFYRDGARLATYLRTPTSSVFVPECGARFSVRLEFSRSREIRYASIGKNDGYILDGFTCTNGIFYPDQASRINEVNAKFVEIDRVTEEPIKK